MAFGLQRFECPHHVIGRDLAAVMELRLRPQRLQEEAALMDGAGYFKIFWRISLPQLRPALSALGIITFTQTWNYYFQAKVLLGPQDAMTLPLAMDILRGYLGQGLGCVRSVSS